MPASLAQLAYHGCFLVCENGAPGESSRVVLAFRDLDDALRFRDRLAADIAAIGVIPRGGDGWYWFRESIGVRWRATQIEGGIVSADWIAPDWHPSPEELKGQWEGPLPGKPESDYRDRGICR
jgi:hypothetical protein